MKQPGYLKMPRPLTPGRRSTAKQHPLLRLAASGSKGMYGFAVTWSGRMPQFMKADAADIAAGHAS